MLRQSSTAAAVASALAVALLPAPAFAHGALAVGADYRADGWTLTVGVGKDYRDGEDAQTRAMQECMMPNRGNLAARVSCRIVTTFNRRCFAIAVDTETGAYGWSVRDDLETAQTTSLQSCVDHRGRKEFCKVSHFGCDKRS